MSKAFSSKAKRVKNWMKYATSCMLLLVAAFSLFGCSSNKTWYEDSNFVITGFKITETSGVYIAKGTIKSKNGASSSAVLATVKLKDKDGNTIATTAGFASDIPENGSADFSIYLNGNNGFLNKKEVESISSYDISHINTSEGMRALAQKKAKEAKRLKNRLNSRE